MQPLSPGCTLQIPSGGKASHLKGLRYAALFLLCTEVGLHDREQWCHFRPCPLTATSTIARGPPEGLTGIVEVQRSIDRTGRILQIFMMHDQDNQPGTLGPIAQELMKLAAELHDLAGKPLFEIEEVANDDQPFPEIVSAS